MFDPIAQAIADNARLGWATSTSLGSRGSSTRAVRSAEEELEACLGLTAAMALKYGTTIEGEIAWPGSIGLVDGLARAFMEAEAV